MTGVVHACPPGDEGVTPCCHVPPFELPMTDRMTLDPELVTCSKPTIVASGPVVVGPAIASYALEPEYDGPVYVGPEGDEPESVDEELSDDEYR